MGRQLDGDPLTWSDDDAAWAAQFPEKYREELAARSAGEASGNPRTAVSPEASGEGSGSFDALSGDPSPDVADDAAPKQPQAVADGAANPPESESPPPAAPVADGPWQQSEAPKAPETPAPKPYKDWLHGDLLDLSARREQAHGDDYRRPEDGRRKASVIEALEAWDVEHPGSFGKVG